MKKTLSIILVIVMLMALVPVAFADSHMIAIDTVAGGLVTADKSTPDSGDTVTLTITPSTGYHLESIITNPAVTISKDNTFTMPEDNVKVTPKFALNTYTVKFHANGGTGEDKTQTFIYNTAQALAENTFTRFEYTFLGWSTDSAATSATYRDKESVNNLTSTNDGIVDLYAIWTPNIITYTITMGKYSGADLGRAYYSADQNTWHEVLTSEQHAVPAQSTVYFKMDPYNGNHRNPYVVNADGSYYSPGEGEIFSVYVNENKTVKLNFAPPPFKIEIDNATGGEVTSDKDTANEGDSVTLTVSNSIGYHLKSLKVNGEEITGNTFTMPKADVKVTPEFALNTYTVKFHANGGTGDDKTQTFTYNEAKALEANTYTKTGYTFLGWSTNSAATAANYGDKESVSNLTSTDGGVVDLYAIWTPSTTDYSVTMGKYSGANLGRAYWSLDQKNWYEVTNEYSTRVNAGTTLYFKMDPYNGYYRHPYVVNANGSYYSPGYGQIFSVVINENKTVKLNFSQYVPTGDAGVWGYVVTMLASAGTAAGVHFGTKKKK